MTNASPRSNSSRKTREFTTMMRAVHTGARPGRRGSTHEVGGILPHKHLLNGRGGVDPSRSGSAILVANEDPGLEPSSKNGGDSGEQWWLRAGGTAKIFGGVGKLPQLGIFLDQRRRRRHA